jgi:multicomponent Na+:H+ antiporter subunit B
MEAIYLVNLFLLFALIVSAFAVLAAKRLLHAVVMGGAFSLTMACEYLVLAAPDVAMTEAAVGTGIASVSLLLALSRTGEDDGAKGVSYAVPAMACAALAGALCAAFLTLPPVGSGDSPAYLHVASEYLRNARTDVGVPNVVTAILASYRGMDTFGEAAVIFAAGTGVYALLAAPDNENEDGA